MTEQEWLARTEPKTMLEFVHPKASDRKLMLFACACARRVWHLLRHDWSRDALRAAEDYLERRITRDEAAAVWQVQNNGLRVMSDDLRELLDSRSIPPPDFHIGPAAVFAVTWVTLILDPEEEENRRRDSRRRPLLSAEGSMAYASRSLGLASGEVSRLPQSIDPLAFPEAASRLVPYLRDIIDPFRTYALPPGCLTPTVLSVAQAAYDERLMPSAQLDPDRLAILSDALEETGCDDSAVLDHLRHPGPHVRGCWALDAIPVRKKRLRTPRLRLA